MGLIYTQDDEFGFGAHAIPLYQKLAEAKHPVELHLLSRGGHGFGMRIEGTTTFGGFIHLNSDSNPRDC